MSLDVIYCFPGSGDNHLQYAWRFLNSMLQFPPMIQCNLVLLTDQSNYDEALEIFSVVPGVRAMVTPDHAKDLSRYEAYIKQCSSECVMMLCGSTYCRKPGWGLVAYRAFQNMGGSNLYGACGHTGAGPVRPHLRSTGFWGSPALLRRYPGWPKDVSGRYGMEHGAGCLSDWVRSQGGQCWVINFGSQHTLDRANDDLQGYARGQQQNLLIGDRLTMPPFQPFA